MTITFYQRAFAPHIVKTNGSPWQNVPLKVTVAYQRRGTLDRCWETGRLLTVF